MKKKNNKAKSKEPSSASFFLFRLKEGGLLLAVAFSLYWLISLASFHYPDPGWSHSSTMANVSNMGGRLGAWLADLTLYCCGYMAYLFPIAMSYSAWQTYYHRHRPENPMPLKHTLIAVKATGFIIIVIAGSALFSLYLQVLPTTLPHQSGGILGTGIAYQSLVVFNFVGSTIVLSTLLLMGVTLLTGVSWFFLVEKAMAKSWRGLAWLGYYLTHYYWLSDVKEKFVDLARAVKDRLAALKEKLPVFPRDSEDDMVLEPQMAAAVDDKPVIATLAPEVVEANTASPSPIKAPRYRKGSIIPKLSLLDKPSKTKKYEFNAQYLEARSKEVEQRLADYGVAVKVVAVYPGPVVTRYELTLAAGTKVSKITTLAKDLARSFSVVSVRVVEVIPGKSVIGLELPNERREDVSLHDVLASQPYEHARSPLSLALGKDIAGHPVVVDLAKMPHLLVAGTTGSGKSVSLNAMLLSLLYKSTPQQMRLILIDPKMLELAVYDGIPHLLTPVVTDMKDAAVALRWCVMEMERRYRLMASLGVRNIAGYNAKVSQSRKRGAPLLDPLFEQIDGAQAVPELEELPRIVVIADEFADMMVVVGKKS